MKLYKNCILIFIITAVFLLSSCNKKEETDTHTNVDVIPSKMTIGMYSPTSYNPLDTTTVYNEQAFYLMYDSLYNINEKYEPVKNLASDLTIENGGNTALIQIKPNVKFHNGETLTANDVAFTINYIIASGGYYDYNVRNIESVTVVNDYTLKLNLKYSTPNIEGQLTFPIIKESSKDTLNGTGPYKLLKENKGKQFELIRHREYHTKFDSKVTKIDINLIPDKTTARSLSSSGILDVFFAAFSDEGLKTVTKSQSVKRDYLTDSYVFLKLNLNSPILFSKDFRKAIMVGINRQTIADNTYMSHASPTALPVPNESMIYTKNCAFEQNQNEAILYMEKAGYKDTDSDGIYEYQKIDEETPEELTPPSKAQLSLLIPDEEIYVNISEAVTYDLKKLGIAVNTVKCQRDAYLEKYNNLEYDMCIVNTNVGYDLDTTAFFGNGGVYSAPIDYNFESVINKLGATHILDLKTSTYSSLFTSFYENPSHIPLVFLKNTLITNDKFKDIDELYINNIYYKILAGKDNKNE